MVVAHTCWALRLLPLLEQRRQRGDFVLNNSLKAAWKQVRIDLFSQAASGRMKGNKLRMYQEKFTLGMRNNFFPKRVIKA